MLDALEGDRTPPVVAQEREVLPGERGVAERRSPVEEGGRPVLVGHGTTDGALEGRVSEVVLVPDTAQERQKRPVEVTRAPSHRGGVERHDERPVARRRRRARGSSRRRRGPSTSTAGTTVGRPPPAPAMLLQRRRRAAADHHRQPERGCRACGDQLAFGMDDPQQADRRQGDRSRHRGAEHGHRHVGSRDVAEEARHDPPRVERGAVRPSRGLGSCRPRDVAEDVRREALLCERLEARQVGGKLGHEPFQPRCVDLRLEPTERRTPPQSSARGLVVQGDVPEELDAELEIVDGDPLVCGVDETSRELSIHRLEREEPVDRRVEGLPYVVAVREARRHDRREARSGLDRRRPTARASSTAACRAATSFPRRTRRGSTRSPTFPGARRAAGPRPPPVPVPGAAGSPPRSCTSRG